MDSDILGITAKVAGIGGLSLGVLLIIFRDIIRKNIFATLTKRQSYKIILLIILLVWSVAIVGIISWVYKGNDDKPVVQKHGIDAEEEFDSDYDKIPYYSKWQVERQDIDVKIKKEILQILKLFKDNEYEEAYDRLQTLEYQNEFSQRFKKDFKTAILFAEKNYYGALESVIQRYEDLPLGDIRHRWDIAYITYFMRRSLGLRESENIISKLREKYNRADISYVWMAIHPNAFKRLLESNLYPYQSLHKTQLNILEYVIEKYPNDAFLDHAYYFLHRYDELIDRFPKSIIIDRAYYSRAYLPYYRKILHKRMDPKDIEIREIGNNFNQFINSFPDNKLTFSAYVKLIKCYLYLQNSSESFNSILKTYRNFLDYTSANENKEDLKYKLSSLKWNVYRAFFHYTGKDGERHYEDIINNKGLDLNQYEIVHQIAMKYFIEKNYEKALIFYKKLPPEWKYGKGEKLRVEALLKINDLKLKKDSKEYLLKMGLILKKTKYGADHAIPFFDKYMLYCDDDEIPKVIMLKAFCYRDSRKGKLMIEQFIELLRKYPNSDFADDALAELGVYKLLWGYGKREEARKIFRQVINKYPKGNAVDNCYNWIAWSYLKDRNWREAYRNYKIILLNFQFSRFANYAKRNIEKIKKRSR